MAGRYQQYENVRNRFAKDVGFSYRRGHEPYDGGQNQPQFNRQGYSSSSYSNNPARQPSGFDGQQMRSSDRSVE